MVPTESDLADAVYRAARAAVSDLFREHPDHHFYYCSLVTTGEAFGPALSAWSAEALAAAVKASGADAEMLKWSYADSPFCSFGEQHFQPMRALFDARPQVFDLPGDDGDAEYLLRLRAMESAMSRLDDEGLFGSGDQRLDIVINVEVMPPDTTNTERALRLNPPRALTTWLEEAAER
jgi:hypothetical protein